MEDIDFDFNKVITVVGLGIIGGSFAYKLSEIGYKTVYGVDKKMDTLVDAKSKGAITQGFFNPKDALMNSDVVILCLYPNAIVPFIQENMPHFKENCLIIDTVGVKENVITETSSILRKDLSFVGGHPMAGSHKVGFSGAKKDLFENASFIITPTKDQNKNEINIVSKIMTQIGFKIVYTTAEEHDNYISYTSQLPHIMSVAYMNSCQFDQLSGLSSNSFEEFTRIAKINGPLWSQLFNKNKENLINKIDCLMDELLVLKEAISDNDEAKLIELLDQSKRKKEALDNNANLKDTRK